MTKEKVIDILKGIKDGTAWLMPNMPEDGEKAIDIAIKAVEQPKTGKWIEYEQKFMTDRPFETIKKHVSECSLCRTKIAGFDGTMRYCPNCRAKMEANNESN